jgi:hypothetical protein
MEKCYGALRQNKETMKRLLIVLFIGSILEILFIVMAAAAGGACHCVTPTMILFPYAAIMLGGPSWESMSTVAMIVEFPLYSVVIGAVRGRAKVLAILAVTVCHIAAVVIALKLYHR